MINKVITGKRIFCLVSGGKDSVTMLDYSIKNYKVSGMIFIDTTIGIQETKDFVISLSKKYDLPLSILKPKKTYDDFVLKFGFPRAHSHRWVFIDLKWKPLYNFWKENKDIIYFSGVRKKESIRRMKNTKEITYDKSGMIFCAPIFNWTTQECWNYIKTNSLKVSPAYKKVHLSGDCLCGAFSSRGESELIQIFYPNIAERIRVLELNCKNKVNTWGRQSSMRGVKDQKRLEQFVCADCHI